MEIPLVSSGARLYGTATDDPGSTPGIETCTCAVFAMENSMEDMV
jgi:hypothetical protein